MDAHPEAGAAVARCVGPDGVPQPILSPEHTLHMAWWRDSGLHLLWPDAPWFRRWLLPEVSPDETAEAPTAQTVCMLVRRTAHEQVGPMDEDLFLFYNDVDLCRRLRAEGWKIHYVPAAEALHHGSASVETARWKERQLWRDRARFFRKWYGSPGVLAVTCACLSRWAVRVLAQLARGRWRRLPEVAREGWELLRGLRSPLNGA
jgi:GT2 family glycosyltransferase